jgi:hypothetical protein
MAWQNLRMSEPIVYVDRSDIRPGMLAELREAVARLAAFVEEREPQVVAYGFHIDEQSSTMWVTAVHPDSASLELHLRIGGSAFREVGEFIVLRAIDVYGEPSDSVVDLLRDKARVLGGASLAIHPRISGFARTSESAAH